MAEKIEKIETETFSIYVDKGNMARIRHIVNDPKTTYPNNNQFVTTAISLLLRIESSVLHLDKEKYEKERIKLLRVDLNGG